MLLFVFIVVVVDVAAFIVTVTVAAALNFCPTAVKERAKSQFARLHIIHTCLLCVTRCV